MPATTIAFYGWNGQKDVYFGLRRPLFGYLVERGVRQPNYSDKPNKPNKPNQPDRPICRSTQQRSDKRLQTGVSERLAEQKRLCGRVVLSQSPLPQAKLVPDRSLFNWSRAVVTHI